MIKRGDVYYADFGMPLGSEQQGLRPVVVLQNDIGNENSPTTIVAAVTSKNKKELPTHVHITETESSLAKDSIVMLEQIRTIDKDRLEKKICHINDEKMEQIDDAVLCSLGIYKTTREENTMYYRNETHKRIYEEQITRNPCKCSNEYLSAIYLLTSNKKLWDETKYKICKKEIDFRKIRPDNFSVTSYTLFSIAEDIYSGTAHIVLNDVGDKYVISEQIFDLIITAIYICRKGYKFIGIEKPFYQFDTESERNSL